MSTSQFSAGEIPAIVVSWLVLSFAIGYTNVLQLSSGTGGSVLLIVAALVATATGFILHEMGHKFVAIRRGHVAHFRVWLWGLALTLATAVVSNGGFLFGAPGAVYIAPATAAGYYGYSGYQTRDPAYDNMVISAAGPGLNLAFALGFLGLLLLVGAGSSFISTIASYGFGLNLGLGSFNMLPVPPLDGSKIFRKNIAVALAIALPLWGMFLYFFFLV